MAKPKVKCKHRVFREIGEGESKWRCIKCKFLLGLNEAVDVLNGEHKSIKGIYEQIVLFVKR